MIKSDSLLVNGKPLPDEMLADFEWRWNDERSRAELWHIRDEIMYFWTDPITLEPGDTIDSVLDRLQFKITYTPQGPGH